MVQTNDMLYRLRMFRQDISGGVILWGRVGDGLVRIMSYFGEKCTFVSFIKL